MGWAGVLFVDSGCPGGSVGDSYHGQLCFVDPRAQVLAAPVSSLLSAAGAPRRASPD